MLKDSYDVLMDLSKNLKRPQNIFIKLSNTTGCLVRPEAFDTGIIENQRDEVLKNIKLD